MRNLQQRTRSCRISAHRAEIASPVVPDAPITSYAAVEYRECNDAAVSHRTSVEDVVCRTQDDGGYLDTLNHLDAHAQAYMDRCAAARCCDRMHNGMHVCIGSWCFIANSRVTRAHRGILSPMIPVTGDVKCCVRAVGMMLMVFDIL